MKMVKTKLALGAAVAALALAGASAASAAVTWTSVGLDAAPGPGETMVLDFDGIAAPGYIIAGGAEASASIPNVAAAPAGDNTDFYYVVGGNTATLLTPVALRTLSLYIGSLDDYNTITFWSGGSVIGSFNGIQLQIPANGDQGSPATNRRFSFNFGSDTVDRIDFSSSKNSFEFDNIAVSAVPEPGVWALMIAGFGMLGAALRRRRTEAGALA